MTRNFILAAALLALATTGASALDLRPMNSTSSAGSTTVNRSYSGVDISRNLSIGAGSTTIYNQPSYGGSGPVQGTQRGSSSSTSYGPMIEYRFR